MAERMKPRTIVRATTHPSESRPNIPTAELESFARPEEKRPAIVRYPRDPTLDPQLVWKGKDEQDAQDLQVPAVPIYIDPPYGIKFGSNWQGRRAGLTGAPLT